jgi:hypothetical protein
MRRREILNSVPAAQGHTTVPAVFRAYIRVCLFSSSFFEQADSCPWCLWSFDEQLTHTRVKGI